MTIVFLQPTHSTSTMTTPATRTVPSKTKRAPSRSEESPESQSGPFLRFYHPEPLRKKTLVLLATVEQAADATLHRAALADLVVELTNCGLDAYFMKPMKLARAGFIVQQSANIGMAGVQQVMASVIRQIIGRMDSKQLLSVCGSIRQFMQ